MFDRETAVSAPLVRSDHVKRVGFRGRLFLILLAFALIPSILISLAWSATGSLVLPLAGATAAWDSVAATGERAVDGCASASRSTPRAAPASSTRTKRTLRQSVMQSRRADYVFRELAQTARRRDAARRAHHRRRRARASPDI